VKDRISRHQGNSPTPIFEIVAALAKGTELLAHQLTLVTAEVHTLRAANEALSKRRRAKKARIRQGGTLAVEEAHDVLSQREVDEQIRRDKRSAEAFQNEGKSTGRRCGSCGKTGHNARTCQLVVDASSSSDSE
jgi:hypothetical protein